MVSQEKQYTRADTELQHWSQFQRIEAVMFTYIAQI